MNDRRPQPRRTFEENSILPSAGARTEVVNRTRRVVRDQALRMQEKRSRLRGLWLPLALCSTLLLVLCYAVWGMLAGYDLVPTGIPDASDQLFFLFLLWSLPVAAVVLGITWFRLGRGAENLQDNLQENPGEFTP